MLEFKKRELQFSWNGEVNRIDFPTVSKIKRLQAEQDKEKNEIDVLEGFLIDLGMKKEVFDEMEVDYITQIVEAVVNPKK